MAPGLPVPGRHSRSRGPCRRLRFFSRAALGVAFLALPGCSSGGSARGGGSDAGDAGGSRAEIPYGSDGALATDVQSWRCTTTTEQPDSGPDSVICSCSKFVVPVDTSDAPPVCASEPCCIADGEDECDCFSASYPPAMDCNGLVAQTNALESSQGLPAQARRVSQCPG